MSVKINETFVVNNDDKKKYKWGTTFNTLHGHGGNHSFAVLDNNGDRSVLTGCSCTGSLPGMYKDKAHPNIVFMSRPTRQQNSHIDYLNTLLHPETSPYKYLMKEGDYKVNLDAEGNIDGWIYTNPDTLMAEIGGLAILERIFTQHSHNPFYDIWKKLGLPFEAFFYLTHTRFGNYTPTRFAWGAPSHPYSAFNMYVPQGYRNYNSTSYHRFSAPRFFQGIPNLKFAKSVVKEPATMAKPYLSNHYANSVWDDYLDTPAGQISWEFESKLMDMLRKYHISWLDSWTAEATKASWNHPTQINWQWSKDGKMCIKYNNEVIEKIVDLLREYTPKFLETKVA